MGGILCLFILCSIWSIFFEWGVGLREIGVVVFLLLVFLFCEILGFFGDWFGFVCFLVLFWLAFFVV